MTADAAIGDAAASDLSSAGFSADQLEDSVAAADGQAAWLAWITSTTGETRDFAQRQLVLRPGRHVGDLDRQRCQGRGDGSRDRDAHHAFACPCKSCCSHLCPLI